MQSGFEHAPGSDGSRSVYSYHYYGRVNWGEVDDYLDARLRDGRRWGCGAMVGRQAQPRPGDVWWSGA